MLSESFNALAAPSPMLELLIKATALLVLTWLLWPLVSRANPRWQVFYWRGAATATLLLPIVVLFGPTIPIPLLEAQSAEPVASVHQPAPPADEWREPVYDNSAHAVGVPRDRAAPTSVALPNVVEPRLTVNNTPATRAASPWSWNAALPAAWLFPALLFLAGALLAERRTARLVRQARSAPAVISELLDQVAGDLGYTRPVRACVSSRVDSPRVVGTLCPAIVLPETAEDHDPTDLRGVFAHEIYHLKSHDLIWSRAFQILSIVLWFHPLAWRLRRQHLDACERTCDAAAAEYVGDTSAYAATLARVALGVIGRRRALAGIAMARKPKIYDRLMRLQNVAPAAPLNRRHVFPLVVTGLALLTVVGGMQLAEIQSPALLADVSAAESQPVDPASPNAGAKYECRLVDIVSRAPIAGGTVSVLLRISGGGKTFEEWPVVRKTEYTSGPKGEFTLEILPEEQNRRNLYVEIEADHPDYVHEYGGYSYTMIKKNLAMGSEPWFKSLGIFPAAKLTGTVVTPDGKPAAGVFVSGSTRLDLASYGTSGHYFQGETDEEGRFQVNVIRGGEAIVWVKPKDYSPSLHLAEHRLSEMSHLAMRFFRLDSFSPDALTKTAKTRDLGQIVLEEGIRIHGRVTDVDGTPIEGIWVNAQMFEGPAKKNYDKHWANIDRSALTDADGRFEMNPLPQGKYRMTPAEEPEERTSAQGARRPVPAVFFAQTVALKEGTETATVDFQAVPHVTVVAQYYNSADELCSGSDVGIFGRHSDGYFSTRKEPSADGRVEFKVPQGLEDASLSLITNEHTALRHRVTRDGPLLNGDRVKLGSLSSDMKDIGIIRYVAPILLIQAVDEQGEPIEGFEAKLLYGPDRSPLQFGGEYLRDGRAAGHVSMDEQSDGRWRTSQLLPDEELTLTVEADGFEANVQTLSIPEGETREIEVTLKKAVSPDSRSE